LAELRRNVRQFHFMRKITVLLSVVVVLLIVGMLGAAYTALETAKEIKANEGKLVDSKGEGVSTYQSSTTLGTLTLSGRRLQLLDGERFLYDPDPKICNHLWQAYTQWGAIHFTANIDPDINKVLGEYEAHTIRVEAAFNDPDSGRYVSGRIGLCFGSAFWVARFNQKQCVVSAQISVFSGVMRRLAEVSDEPGPPVNVTKELLSRASMRFEKDVQTSLESSLGGEGRGLLADKCKEYYKLLELQRLQLLR